ncbi:MAG: hypothetical protein ABIU08_26495 [Acidimicrobiales bacterium]
MNGTGIVQHDVSLPDIEAGVTYTYVFQGTTADGTLYRSDIGTFHITGSTVRRQRPSSPPARSRHVGSSRRS